MKTKHILTASILALSSVTVSQATEVVLHGTGSTAFRKAFVQSVEDQMNGSGAYTVAYLGSGTTLGAETGVNDVVLRGTINGQAVTVKVDWTGSVGGVIATAKQISPLAGNIPGAKGWMSITNLPSIGQITGGAITSGNETLLAVASPSYSLDTGTFPTETNAADVTMSDSFQSSTIFFTKPALPAASAAEIVGIVPFEWVANNGAQSSLQAGVTATTVASSTTITLSAVPAVGIDVNAQLNVPNGNGVGNTYFGHVISVSGTTLVMDTAPTASVTTAANAATLYYANPISNINTNQANALMTGGLFLSQLTGNTTSGDGNIDDDATFVYAMGRNFDSGTRLAAMNETGLGTAGAPQQMVPNDVSTGASAPGAGTTITSFALTPPTTLYPSPYTQSFAIGGDGFSSGGTLATWMSLTGSYGAAPTVSDVSNGYAPLFDTSNGGTGTGGWIVGYLGRSDADTAVTSSATAPNTAHRVTWNGVPDWFANQATTKINFNAYADVEIEQGLYTFWEYEHFLAKNGGVSAAQQTVCNGIYTQLTGTTVSGDTLYGSADVPLTGILSGNMAVSKLVEGGIITHN